MQKQVLSLHSNCLLYTSDAADEPSSVDVGGSYDKFYGELSAVTNEDLVDWGAKAGVKFTF